MYPTLFTYGKDLLKIPLDCLDDPIDNDRNYRIYRDKSTDTFVSTLFTDKEKLYKFLDYTYHALNSKLIININIELMKLGENYPEPIRPINNNENIHLIFKGVT